MPSHTHSVAAQSVGDQGGVIKSPPQHLSLGYPSAGILVGVLTKAGPFGTVLLFGCSGLIVRKKDVQMETKHQFLAHHLKILPTGQAKALA